MAVTLFYWRDARDTHVPHPPVCARVGALAARAAERLDVALGDPGSAWCPGRGRWGGCHHLRLGREPRLAVPPAVDRGWTSRGHGRLPLPGPAVLAAFWGGCQRPVSRAAADRAANAPGLVPERRGP